MAKFSYVQEVEFVDVDSMGVMWHGNYARKMELARCKFLDSLKYGYKHLEDLGYFFPVVEMNISYFYPTRYEDVIEIFVQVLEAKVYIGLEYQMYAAGKHIATGYTRHILVNAKNNKALRKIPQDFLKALLEFKE